MKRLAKLLLEALSVHGVPSRPWRWWLTRACLIAYTFALLACDDKTLDQQIPIPKQDTPIPASALAPTASSSARPASSTGAR
jgi:hypothetical protein